MKIHFTSTAFHGEDRQEKLKRCRDCAESFGWEFGVQLHNTAPTWIIETLAKEGVPLSVHGPLNQDRFWNLSRKEIGDTLAAMDRNFAVFEKLGIHIFGVTLKQHWNSSNYSDVGYLFLMINFEDEMNPSIQVRTWQPDKYNGKPLPRDEVFSLDMFSI